MRGVGLPGRVESAGSCREGGGPRGGQGGGRGEGGDT